jgi:hypothetical protein
MHGHRGERMYAAWLEGATESDIHAIKQAMETRPTARAAFLDSRIDFFGSECSEKSRETDRDLSPKVPRMWQ